MEGGYLATESYNYDANNWLVSTARAGSTTSLRSYYGAGQVIEQTTFSSPGTVCERRVSSYNSNGWVTEHNVYNGSGTRTQRTLHTSYDGVGNNTVIPPFQDAIISSRAFSAPDLERVSPSGLIVPRMLAGAA